jgi:hypothetical protein
MRTRKEGEIWRHPVPCHEAFEIVAVPGLLLVLKESPDWGYWIGGLWSLGKQRNKSQSCK